MRKNLKKPAVVPFAGDVDRNVSVIYYTGARRGVVPFAGDVDRNYGITGREKLDNASSPSRGTWIEIQKAGGDMIGRD